MEVSSLLLITVLVNDESIGSRQLKCESSLDTVKTVLDSVSNTTEFMCQVCVHSFTMFSDGYYYLFSLQEVTLHSIGPCSSI